jgi:hypothetical protein
MTQILYDEIKKDFVWKRLYLKEKGLGYKM